MDEAEDEAYSPTPSANAESVPVQVKLEQQQTTNNRARKRKRDEISQLSKPLPDLQQATAQFTTEDQPDAAAASRACAAVKRLRDEQIYQSGHEIPIVTVNEKSLLQKWENMAKATRFAFPQGIKRPRPRGEPGLGGCMHSLVTSTQHDALLTCLTRELRVLPVLLSISVAKNQIDLYDALAGALSPKMKPPRQRVLVVARRSCSDHECASE